MKKTIAAGFIAFVLFEGFLSAQNPSRGWLRYPSPEDAGWPSDALFRFEREATR